MVFKIFKRLRQLLCFVAFTILLGPASSVVVKYLHEPTGKGVLIRTVKGDVGGTLVLPCDVTPPDGDRVALILWYRDQIKEAIYTYDARRTNITNGELKQQLSSHDPSLRSRSSFHPFHPANLTIRYARASDAGFYQCRVDFKNALSKTTYLHVRITAPPKSIHLEDSNGAPVNDIIAANLQENVTIVCVVLGGDPRPYMWWTINGKVMESKHILIVGMRTECRIAINHLSRKHHDTSISCQASAPNSSMILAEKTTLKINTPPLKVWLEGIPETLVADRKYRFSCGVSGVYPGPIIKWTIMRRDSLPVELSQENSSGVENDLYWIEYVVQGKDNGAQFNCSAASPVLVDTKLDASTYMTVHYAPILKIGLGEHLSPASIKEGTDVYFRCIINTNPKVYKVSWFHGEEEIRQSSELGILVSNDHLVIQKVTRHWTGEFTCRASNVVGDSISNKLNITIQFAPICSEEALGMFEASLGEEIFLPCRVQAYPSNVTFYWTFANTVTQVERLPQKLIRSKGLESILRYRLKTPQDYGSLQCWAINVAGEQREACSVSLKPAGAPTPPNNCSVSNQTWDSLEISCKPPKVHFNPLIGEREEIFEIFKKFGNLSKTSYRRLWRDPINVQYLLTIYEQETLRMVHNETGRTGIFLIRQLSPGLDYLITISRFNDRGRSSEITLEAFTLKTAENRMRDEIVKKPPPPPYEQPFPSLTVAVVGAVTSLLALTLLVAIVIKRRCRADPPRPKSTVSLSSLGEPPDLLEKKDFSPSNTTITHSSLPYETSAQSDISQQQLCVASIEGSSNPESQMAPHQSYFLSHLPPPPELFMNPNFVTFQSQNLPEGSPSNLQCQCLKIPTPSVTVSLSSQAETCLTMRSHKL